MSDTGIRHPFAWVVGHGGSGTKRVYNLLDQSPLTHCHMASESDPASPFGKLPGQLIVGDDDHEALEAGWDAAVDHLRDRLSRYDHMPPPAKAYLPAWPRRVGLWRVVSTPRARRLFGTLMPALRGLDWPLPWWLGDRARMRSVPLVMKMNKVPGWAAWVLGHRPEARIVHVVRHPAGFLNAWLGRFYTGANHEAVERANRQRLGLIAQRDARWTETFGDLEHMSAPESELWFWRYATETVYEAGRAAAGYLLVTDESVVRDPIGAAGAVYEHVGLEMPGRVRRWIDHKADEWSRHTRRWREMLDDDHVRLVERVLADSGMSDWWGDDERVSDYSYVAYDTSY